jgi:hypothetical protein
MAAALTGEKSSAFKNALLARDTRRTIGSFFSTAGLLARGS